MGRDCSMQARPLCPRKRGSVSLRFGLGVRERAVKRLWWCLGFFLWVGCTQSVIGETYLDWVSRSFQQPAASVLGPGDLVAVRVFREDSLSGEFRVAQDGRVRYPVLGVMQFGGKTCAELEEELTEALAGRYLQRPSVNCEVIEQASLRVVVVGHVRQPKSVPYTEALTVVEAVALAGGITENAARDRAVVTRTIDGVQHEIEVPLQLVMSGRAPNLRLWPNDTVFIPSYRFFP